VTKAEKYKRYDATAANADKLACAVHDLVNGKFSLAVRVHMKDFDRDWTVGSLRNFILSPWRGGFYSMRVSPRAMPIYVVSYAPHPVGPVGNEEDSIGQVVSCQPDQVDVYTEAEIDAMDTSYSIHARMLQAGKAMLADRANTGAFLCEVRS